MCRTILRTYATRADDSPQNCRWYDRSTSSACGTLRFGSSVVVVPPVVATSGNSGAVEQVVAVGVGESVGARCGAAGIQVREIRRHVVVVPAVENLDRGLRVAA